MVEDGDVFLWLVSRPQLFGENGHRKWRFLKTPAFCLHVDGRKRRFSKYDDVIRHILLAQRMLWYLHSFSVFVCTGENDSNTLRVDVYFFENGEISLFKNTRVGVDGT